MRIFAWALLAAVFISTGACMGGGFITRPELSPPPISESQARPLAEHAGVPAGQPILVSPAGLRVFPEHPTAVILDVMMVMDASECWWEERPTGLEPLNASQVGAAASTSGIGVPAEFRSQGGRDGPSVEIRSSEGRVLKGARALLGVAPFEENHAWLRASENAYPNRLIELDRVGRTYRVFFVPVLLSVDEPVNAGTWYEVRISDDPRRSDLDQKWYRLRAEPFAAPEPGR